jgi:hypothetical protein
VFLEQRNGREVSTPTIAGVFKGLLQSSLRKGVIGKRILEVRAKRWPNGNIINLVKERRKRWV